MSVASIRGDEQASARTGCPGASEDHEPAGAARESVDLRTVGVASELPLEHDVPREQREHRGRQNRDRQPLDRARQRSALGARLLLASALLDRGPRSRRWRNRLESEWQRADDRSVLFDTTRARRARDGGSLDARALGWPERVERVRGQILAGHGLVANRGALPPPIDSKRGPRGWRKRSLASRVPLLIVPSGSPSSRADPPRGHPPR